MKLFTAVSYVGLFLGAALGQGYTPSNGFVPDGSTAVRTAEAVLIPVYGETKIESERPFIATLKKGVWTVEGTLRCSDGKGGFTEDCVGGVATLQLSKQDGRIISMVHYK
jgi:hypothetical protein